MSIFSLALWNCLINRRQDNILNGLHFLMDFPGAVSALFKTVTVAKLFKFPT